MKVESEPSWPNLKVPDYYSVMSLEGRQRLMIRVGLMVKEKVVWAEVKRRGERDT